MVVGGAGTIGQAVSREIFKRDPQALHVVDISENNMVELVRDLEVLRAMGVAISKHSLSIVVQLNSKR